jgi:uncharacterized repeat protein (TIGR04138 family)
MQKAGFSELIDRIVAEDARYDREAYVFANDALAFTLKQRKRKDEGSRHVTGRELLDGVRQYALKEFGPMVMTVFAYWGIGNCEDIGEIVFSLIRAGEFQKTEEDSIEHFKNGFSFREAFVDPFLPAGGLSGEVGQPLEKPR